MLNTSQRKNNREQIRNLSSYIDCHDGFYDFGRIFYSRCLHGAFNKALGEQEGYSHVFNNITISILKPGASLYTGQGFTAFAMLENEETADRIVLTGEVIKASLFNHKFFQVSSNNPEKIIDDIFSKTNNAYAELTEECPNEHQRTQAVKELLTPIHDVDAVFETKISPLMA